LQAPPGGGGLPPDTDQVNVVDPVAPVLSLAVTVTEDDPDAVGVPEITPVEELIDRPAGSPLAL